MWEQSITLGSRTLTLQTGKIAKQAHGAVVVRDGKTVLLSTVVHSGGSGGGGDFLPLTVDYRPYLSAAGRIPGSFGRREGRGGDPEVLASRLCDRSLRPLFPKGFRAETQVLSTVLSLDFESNAPVLGIIGAAAALHISEIPWQGPLAAIRVCRVQGQLVSLPTPDQVGKADLDLVVSVSREGVVMIEGGARQALEADVVAAISFAQQQLAPLLDLMDELRHAAGRPKATLPSPAPPPAFWEPLQQKAEPALAQALRIPDKLQRRQVIAQAKSGALTETAQAYPEAEVLAHGGPLLDRLEERLMRAQVVQQRRRLDGRTPEGIRPITCEVDWLPATHGSALFTRGETQAMVSLTLGTMQDRALIETVEGVRFERFLLHYNFPGYSVGEARAQRGPGRREIGHGALARRALEAVLPHEGEFPYTLRIVSEISESNGSSSMATICGGTLALMDGGVPIAAPVAGIAMGLVKEGEELVILSDILGDEDHLGDMDFKVAGTAQGVTAIQMDNKIGSLPEAVMARAFEQARAGRLHILAEMAQALAAPRPELKPHSPLHALLTIAPNRVRDLIGPGGKVIQEIQRTTGAKLEVDDVGSVRIYAPHRAARDAAQEAVLEKAGSLEIGQVYEGVVTGVKDFGAFVRVRGQEGMVHRSEWGATRVESLIGVAKEGEAVRVKVLATDRAGKLSLSRKAAL
ncbi:MAG TPA: polyribonucleotide nucleotidyltransferase [bacterium]|nr:polyribonucleotide nucleotidyltransferase [bacterium]